MGLFDLFRPKWKHSDPDTRLEAAREMTDQTLLRQMAATDRDWFVRHRVFDIIREQDPGDAVFAFLAKSSSDEEIRRKAVKKLRDQAVLEDVAKNDKYQYVRDAAEHRLEELRTNLYGETNGEQAKAAPTPN
jgi:hypothetical protein